MTHLCIPHPAWAGLHCAVTRLSHLTVIGDIWYLKPFAAVAFIGLELDPELTGAGGEGDGPLVSLTGLIGGDRRR